MNSMTKSFEFHLKTEYFILIGKLPRPPVIYRQQADFELKLRFIETIVKEKDEEKT
jgi:hypothetical protein